MVALSLFDMVLSGEDGMGRSTIVAPELIQAALDDIRHIENLDESLAPFDNQKFDRQTVALVRGMYEEWIRTTDALLERITRVEQQQGDLSGSGLLRDAHGRTRAMLAIPLSRLERDHYLAETSGAPLQEVRRELRLGTY